MTFCSNIPDIDISGHQTALQVPTSLNVWFCTTWGKRKKRNVTFLSKYSSVYGFVLSDKAVFLRTRLPVCTPVHLFICFAFSKIASSDVKLLFV